MVLNPSNLQGPIFSLIFGCLQNGHISVKWPKMKKCEGTLSFQALKVEKSKVLLLFSVLTIMTKIWPFCNRPLVIFVSSTYNIYWSKWSKIEKQRHFAFFNFKSFKVCPHFFHFWLFWPRYGYFVNIWKLLDPTSLRDPETK